VGAAGGPRDRERMGKKEGGRWPATNGGAEMRGDRKGERIVVRGDW
jgi:hypothetical protein